MNGFNINGSSLEEITIDTIEPTNNDAVLFGNGYMPKYQELI
jgi:hypothetical protein